MNQPLRPAVPYLHFDAGGQPYLRGTRCRSCLQTHVGDVLGCPRCGARTLDQIPLSSTGRLYNYTIVHRSAPGVHTPFIAAVVDLDQGGTVVGNLLGVEPDVAALRFDMRVKVVFEEAPIKDREGNGYLIYSFRTESTEHLT
jgi:uncharacterized OB-fold protein